ncbi:hypothetical protein [Kitasatospora sp. MAP5-34]|uniref:hypothetical protein n=1 Tax=Kitasatospora sp. MAP5-34 TaxID=3035102 RepID=UPI0024733A11|nr:hypothetical protein [Kitasatospora sp. MAP5-34]MDH6580663.1 hypothetical protein [Kitasatospora sp. MAP5-34]
MTRRKSIRQFLLTTITALGAALSLGTAPAMATTPSWNQLPIPSVGSLHSITAFSSTSAFGTTYQPCGGSTCSQLWQLNGQNWSQFSLPTGFGAAAITGTSATDVWFLGGTTTAGIVYHWDGQNWVDRSPGVPGYYVQAAAAVSPTSAFSAGVFYGNSEVAGVGHWDGSTWTVTKLPQITGENTMLTAVSAASASDAWATGQQCKPTGNDRCQPYLAHWDGTQWSQVTVPSLTPRSALPQAVISRNGEVWIAGRETDLDGGTNPDRIFAEHWDGQSWTTAYLPVNISADGSYSYVTGLAFHGTDLLAGVSHTLNEGVMDWNGSSWAPYPGPLTTTPTVNSLVGTPDGQVIAAGNGTDATGTHDFLADLPG